MPINQPPSVSVSRRRSAHSGVRPHGTVVWVRGEHDITTRVRLSATIAQAAARGDTDIVVDLSGVTFMDASTIGAIVGAGNRLRARAGSLSVRAPPPRVRQLLDLCGLATMVEERPASARPPAAAALGSWVDVPAGARSPDSVQPPVEEPGLAPAQGRVEREGSTQQLRAPS